MDSSGDEYGANAMVDVYWQALVSVKMIAGEKQEFFSLEGKLI